MKVQSRLGSLSAVWRHPAVALLFALGGLGLFNACGGGGTSSLITPPTQVQVLLSPGPTATVNVSGTLAFTATVTGAADQRVTWQVDGSAGGSTATGIIDDNGVYTAPGTQGTHAVTAVSTADVSKSTFTTVTVLPSGGVTLAPAGPIVLAPSGTITFVATVAGTANAAVTWTVDGAANGNASTGTLAGTGTTVTYTAPSSGSHTVTATNAADASFSASAVVSVSAATVSIGLLPAGPVTINATGTQTFTPTVAGTSDSSVTWTVDGIAGGNAAVGTLPATGTSGVPVSYLAPASAGSHSVKATSAADSTKSATATVVVQLVQVSLSPQGTTTVAASGTRSFTATVSGSSNTGITWTVDGIAGGNATVGTIPASGSSATYSAPATAGSHTVTATSSADGSKSASTTVTVTAPVVSIVLTPSGAVSLVTSGTKGFTATVSGSSNTSVTWAVDGINGGNATVGTIPTSGASATYTAPAAAGSHTITATSGADPTKSASATVNVTLPVVTIVLNPSGTVSVTLSGTRSFTATVSGTSSGAVTWKVDGISGGNATVGTIPVSGTSGTAATYSAPATAGTHTVTAVSVADSSKTASSTVDVQAPAPTSVSLEFIGPANIIPGGSTLFTASVSGASDTSVTWTVDGIAMGNTTVGTIRAPLASSGQAVYTAPTALGTHQVIATSVADPGEFASITLAITATTVPTDSLTQVSVKSYGAAGDGATDDTAAFIRAVSAVAGTGKALWVPAGTYMINPTLDNGAGIRLASNMTLWLDPGAVLQAESTSTQHYEMVVVSGCQNVNIVGGSIFGNNGHNSIPTPTALEDGTCIRIVNSSNVILENVAVGRCFCDGVYIGGASDNVVLCNVTSLANRRHGMAVTYASNLLAINSTFSGNTGSVEDSSGAVINGCGIDLEPNSNSDIVNVLVAGCAFAENYLAGVGWGVGSQVSNFTVAGIYMVGNTLTRNGHGLDVENCDSSVILGNTLADNTAYGIYIHDAATHTLCEGNTVSGTGSSGDGAGIECYRDAYSVIDRNTSTGSYKNGIYVSTSTSPTVTNNICTGNGGAGVLIYNSTNVTNSGNSQ